MKMKRFIAMLLAVVMTVGLLPPVAAVAEQAAMGQQISMVAGTEYQFTYTPGAAGDYLLVIQSEDLAGKNLATDEHVTVSAVDAGGQSVSTWFNHAKGDLFAYAFEDLSAQAYTISVTPKQNITAVVHMETRGVLNGISSDTNHMGGKVDETAAVFVRPDNFNAYEFTYTWSSSNDNVVKVLNIENNDHGNRTYECDVNLQYMGAGDATITVTAVDQANSQNTHSCTINVHVDSATTVISNTITEDTAYSASLAANEKLELTFTPGATGYYWLKNHNADGWSRLSFENLENAFDFDEGNYAGPVYYLTAGQPYTLTENFDEAHDFTVTLEQVTTATNVEFEQPTMRVQVGSLIDPTLKFTGGMLGTRFNIDNTNVTWQRDGMNAHSCRYLMIGAGTLVVTATTVNKHDSSIRFEPTCTVTVDPAAYHETDVEEGTTGAVSLNSGDNAVLEFTPDETGTYFVGYTGNVDISWLAIDRAEGNDIGFGDEYCDSNLRGNFMELEQGKLYWLVFTAHEDLSAEFTVTKQIPATGITFNDVDIESTGTVTCTTDEEKTIYVTMSPNGALDKMSFESSNPEVAEVVEDSGDSFNIRGYQAGETVITITTGGGAQRTLTVTVEEPADPPVNPPEEPSYDDQWEITQSEGETVTYVYSPAESGFYFIGTRPENGDPLKLNDDSVRSYDWDDSDGWGFVYELQAGTAYTFENTSYYDRTFTMFVKKVEEASDFSIPATLSGNVGETLTLPFTFTGTLSTHPVSDKEYVVKCNGGNAQQEQLKLLSEGIAVITVTDHHGNVHTCTVTVGPAQETPEIWNGGDFGFAANEIAEYFYTADSSEQKLFYVESEASVTVTVKNADGSEIAGSYPYTFNGNGAMVVTVTEGEKYLITVSGQSNSVGKLWNNAVQEATEIYANGNTEFFPDEGKQFEIDYMTHGNGNGIAIAQVTVTSDNENVVRVVSCSNERAVLEAVEGGEAQITAALPNGAQVVFSVTVQGFNNQGSIEIGENELELSSTENTHFTFTPDTDGLYWFHMTEETFVGIGCQNTTAELDPEWFEYTGKGFSGNTYELVGGESYTFTIGPENRAEVTLCVAKVTEATTFEINGGKDIVGTVNSSVTVPLTADANKLIRVQSATSSNDEVFCVNNWQNASVELYLAGSGSADLVVTLENGTVKTVKVTVQTYEDTAAGSWEGDPEEWAFVEFTYTAEEDGYYFLNHDYDHPGFVISETGNKPQLSFEWNDTVKYTGYVYKLEAGKTYTLRSEQEIDWAYTVYMHKVEEATEITIPATISGTVGGNTWLDVQGDGVFGHTTVSSDEGVVYVGEFSPHGESLYFVGEGTANITVTDHNGKTKTCEVTVNAAGINDVSSGQSVALNANGSIQYYYTPDQSGWKALYVNDCESMTVTIQNADGSELEDCFPCVAYGQNGVAANLTAETKYLITIRAEERDNGALFIDDAQLATSINTSGNIDWFPTEGETVSIGFDLEGSDNGIVVDQVKAVSSNESIVTVLDVTGNSITLKAVNGGVATVTLTLTNGATAVYNVTVQGFNDQGSLTVGDHNIDISAEEDTRFTFTPTESGLYWISKSEDTTPGMWLLCGNDIDPESFDYRAGGKNGQVYTLEANKTYTFNVTPSETESNVDVFIAKVTEATSFEINGGKDILGMAGEELTIYLTAGENEIIRVNSATSSNEDVFSTGDRQNDSVKVYLSGSGTAVLTVTLENGTEKTIQVTVQTYDDQAAGKWEGQLDDHQVMSMTFTAEEDGFYFLNHQYGMQHFEITNEGAVPLMSFEYNDTSTYTGYVYKLEKGKTYTIQSDCEFSGYYCVYMHKVDEATDFSIHVDDDVEKKVGNSASLNVRADGVMSHTITSSNENVVLVGAPSPHGAYIHYVGEGTATLTVTDHNGNRKTYQITVQGNAGIQELRNDMEIALPGRTSVSYYFIPQEDGYYWIRPGQKADFSIQIHDSKNVSVHGITWAEEDSVGTLVELTAGEKYLLTFTAAQTQLVRMWLSHPEEPMGVWLEGEAERFGFVDEMMLLSFNWTPQMGYVTITAESSDPRVVQVVGTSSKQVALLLVNEGEATVTITTANGHTLACSITVRESKQDTISLGEEKTVQLLKGERICYSFTAEEDGYVYLWKRYGEMSYLDIYGLDENDEKYELTKFNHDGQDGEFGGNGVIFEVKAGETYHYYVEALADVDTVVKLQSIEKASSVVLEQNSITGYERQSIYVSFNPQPEGSFLTASAWVLNSRIASIDCCDAYGMSIYLERVGNTTIKLTINDETIDIPVVVKPVNDILQPGEENELVFHLQPGEMIAVCCQVSCGGAEEYIYGNGSYEIINAEILSDLEFGTWDENGPCDGYVHRVKYRASQEENLILITNPYDVPMDITVGRNGQMDLLDMEIVAKDEYQLGEEFTICFKPFPIYSEPEHPYQLSFDRDDILNLLYEEAFSAGFVATKPGRVTISLEALGYEAQHTIDIVADTIDLDEDKQLTIPYNSQRVVTFTAPADGFYDISFTAQQELQATVEGITPWMNMDPNGDHSISVQMTQGETYVICYEVRSEEEGETDVTIRVTDDAAYVTEIEILKAPDKTSYFRDYLDQAFTLGGIELRVIWSDGTEEDYGFDRLMYNGMMLGDYPLLYNVAAQAGDKITIAVGTSYEQDEFDITLIDCNITGFEVLGPAKLTIPEHAYGAMEDPGWIYSAEYIREFLKFKISFEDGTSVTIPGTQAMYDGYGLFDSIPNDQYDSQWELDGTYTMLFGFLEFSDVFEVTIVENPVKNIEVITAPSFEFVFGNEEYGTMYPEEYVFTPANYDQYKGLSFKVIYTDGTEEIVTADMLTWPYGNDYGEGIFGWYNGFPVETYFAAGYFYGEYEHGAVLTEPATVTVTIRYGWACDEYTLTLAASHVHDLTEVPAKAATCAEDGYIQHWTCSGCDVLFGDAEGEQIVTEEEIILTDGEHSYYDEWVPMVDYHCHKCEHCGDEKDITPHSAFVNKADLAYLISVNDCVEFYFKQCPDCGRGSDPDQVFTVAREDATHVWDEGSVTASASCTAPGVMTFKCTNKGCEATKTEVIEQKNHNLSETKGKAATCTEDGNINFWTCNDCKTKFADAEGKTVITGTITLTKNGHVVSKVEAKAATCTEDGNVEYWICTACDHTFSDQAATTEITEMTVRSQGHKLTAVEAKEATYTTPGNIAHWTCSGCDVLFGDAEGNTTLTDVVIPQLIKVEEEKAEVSEDAMDNAITEALKPESDDSGDNEMTETVKEVVLPVKNTSSENTVNSVSLPVASIEKIVETNKQVEAEVVLTVEMDSATVTLDSKALEAVAEQVGSSEVTLKVKEIQKEVLNEAQQNIVENHEVEMIISAELVGGDISVHDFGGGTVTIKLPFNPPAGTKGNDYKILYVADNGEIEKIKTTYVEGHLVFTLTHFSEYIVVNEKVTEDVTNPETNTPPTGDSTDILLLTFLMFATAVSMAVLEISKKRYAR